MVAEQRERAGKVSIDVSQREELRKIAIAASQLGEGPINVG